ncbi:ABC transporter permease [Nordella sp. HKS 07]|uniref:ABC transporter permease n=1 Tax=Nordella sp. HKS 07 TaxID=2712222 RepID=UPI0013E10FBB|nr:ABC transporter permease [Nordella sp. HKS 07]QIG48960.1 ABC transporter permease [Nordella sp. HKS 07]
MSTDQTADPARPRSVKARRTVAQNVWRTLKKAPYSAWFGMIVIAIYIFVALFAPWIAPYGEAEVVSQQPFELWSATHWLGTDQLGRDMFTRILYGARNTLGIALATTLLAFAIGGGLGIIAAIFRGWVDQLLSRAVDALMAIPLLIFALILLSIFGSSVKNLIIIIAVLDSTRVFRLARSVAMNVVVMDYVEAAKLRGEKLGWILFREVLPNIMPTMVAELGLRFCFVFLTISSLSFLGLGIQPPTADWGTMVRENATLITYGDITPLIPAGAIALLTVAVNFVVDWFLHKTSGLRDEK